MVWFKRRGRIFIQFFDQLWLWKEASKYSKSGDWIFASPHTQGKYPFWPDILLLKIMQPAARRAGIKKRIGWHTFRHSYSSLLVANGENVKVVQELMRHASSRFTLDVYAQAQLPVCPSSTQVAV